MSEYTTRQILDMIEANGGAEGLDLSGKDLREIDLSRETIWKELAREQEDNPEVEPLWVSGWTGRISLGESKLQKANLWHANLQGANLLRANLQKAYLGGAKLQEADLRRAKLQEADLSEANLQRAILAGADLQRANLGYANLQEADLGYANLQHAYLNYANLQEVNLERGNLQEAQLQGADLQRAFLVETKLQKARLEECDLREAQLWRANLQEAYLKNANLQKARLQDSSLQEAILWDADLQGANLGSVNLRKADLQGAILQEACLSGANLQEANLQWANLTRVNLLDAVSLERISLYQAILRETQLTSDQLRGGIGEELSSSCFIAKEVYLALKNNFDQTGRYDGAAWAYRKERRMEKLGALRKARQAREGRRWREAAHKYAKVAGDQLVELVCDYGESIGRVFGAMVAVWLLFALVYGLIAGVWGPWQDAATGRIRHITRNPIHLLAFSLGAMTTLEPTGLEARDTIAMQVLTPLEALLGIALAGLLGFVAGNRIRRS